MEIKTDNQDFSLVLGGPLFQLFRKAHLSGTDLELLKRRVVFIVLFTWLPLLVLSALNGKVVGSDVPVPFLFDLETQIRYLIIIPLLVSAELIVHKRMRTQVSQFLKRKLIPEDETAKFYSALTSSLKLRNSVLAEVILVLFVYIVGVMIIWPKFIALKTNTWYMSVHDGESVLSPAGIWLGYVSIPFFQFLLIRWYYRIFIWIRFLWKVSRIKLNLIPLHPDRLGGLGFLTMTVFAFIPLVIAHGALISGQISNRIFYLGESLLDFKPEIFVVILFLFFVFLVPLMVFSPQLAESKRNGKRLYGIVAQDYVREFDYKWLQKKAPPDEPLIGSSDIQSLADLGNSYEVVDKMKIIPFSRDGVIQIIGAALLPILPLALTLMPLEELLKKLVSVLF
ncbi:MAG: hypothetical protein JNJ56_14235 [Ignavibacteria bacterium]|nr:hypothetical protein [Ignavibacteria bacterium]